MLTEEKKELEFSKARDELVKLYHETVLKPILPKSKVSSVSSMGTVGQPFGYAKIGIKPTNESFKGSQYYYNKKTLQFIHYTSLENAINIIREKSIRMYDLTAMNDPQEVLNSMSQLYPTSEDLINKAKKNAFILSMCEYEEELSGRSFDNWRVYGKDGFGVGIVLEFSKSTQDNWFNRYLGKVHYNIKSKKTLNDFINEHLNFKEKNHFNISDPLNSFFLPIAGFHKDHIYSNEKEIRYLRTLTHMDWDKEKEVDFIKGKQVFYKQLKLDYSYSKKIKELIKKPNFSLKEATSLAHCIPEVKINSIILGYKYSNHEEHDIHNTIEILSKEKLGYYIPVKTTGLKKFF